MPFRNSGPKHERPAVILLVDVDCFEVQVWEKEGQFNFRPGTPCLTHNESGIITSVNHEAKKKGISRKTMTLGQAKKKCPDLQTIRIPNRYGKPDSRPPRLASYIIEDKVDEFFKSIEMRSGMKCDIEKNSKDEYFIDVTMEVAHRLSFNYESPSATDLMALLDRTHLLNHKGPIEQRQKKFHHRILNVLAHSKRSDHRLELGLVHGAIIADRLIVFLKQETGYQCSAGIGHNLLTAKLACGLIKPAGIAILPTNAIARTSKSIRIEDIPKLGGVTGRNIVKRCKIKTMLELAQAPHSELAKFVKEEEEIEFLRSLARGEDSNRVIGRTTSQSITCGKSFRGRQRIGTALTLFLGSLCLEMCERLQEELDRNSRTPHSFRIEIKCCRNEKYRQQREWTLVGNTFGNDSAWAGDKELLTLVQSNIDMALLTDDVMPKIVKISLTATFPKRENTTS